MTKQYRYSKKENKDVPYYLKTLNFSGDDVKLVEDFNFYFGEEVLTNVLKCCMRKCVQDKTFLEFIIFDDIDDFVCTRKHLLGGK